MRSFLLILLLLQAGIIMGQDIHFSQFFHSPTNLNPALTGTANAKFRVVGNQRTQWRSVTRPYNTFSISGDAKQLLHPNLGLGVSMFNDKAGDSRLNTFQFNISGSWTIPHPSNANHSFTGGLQTGVTNRKLDFDELSFDNQYNGFVYIPNSPTGESFERNSRFYLNLNAGVSWNWKTDRRKWIQAGFALHNINTPKQSFYNDESIHLDRRITIHGSGETPINEKLALRPVVSLMWQGTFSEYLTGAMLQYEFISDPLMYRAVFAGYMGRFSDSGVIVAGVEYDDWRFGVSYDLNLSDLETASQSRGGFEFALIKLFNRDKQLRTFHKFCPDFL